MVHVITNAGFSVDAFCLFFLLALLGGGVRVKNERIDCLYVEQEVVADDTPAVIAVMKADKARWVMEWLPGARILGFLCPSEGLGAVLDYT